jgi:hypothetical protein
MRDMTDVPGWTPPVEPGDGATGWAPPPGAAGTPGYPQPGYAQQWGQQNSPWGSEPAAVRPGVIPLRPLAFGELLDGAFAVVREYPKVTLGLSAIVVAITQGLSFLLAFNAVRNGFARGNVDVSLAFVVGAALDVIGGLFLAGMLTAAMGDAVLGREPTFGSMWARVRPRLWTLLGVSLVAGVLPFLGLVLFVIPGIFLWGALALVTPALVLEGLSFGAAFRRSWRLAVPDWWRVWGTRALTGVIAVILTYVIMLPFSFAATGLAGDSGLNALPITLVVLGRIVAGTITMPFTSGVLALLYVDRRMRAEGLDVTLTQAAAAEAARR